MQDTYAVFNILNKNNIKASDSKREFNVEFLDFLFISADGIKPATKKLVIYNLSLHQVVADCLLLPTLGLKLDLCDLTSTGRSRSTSSRHRNLQLAKSKKI